MVGYKELKAPEIVEVKRAELEADSTHYEMLAMKIKGTFSMGTLGTVTDGWLVVSHLNRKAYLFQPKGYLDILYVTEKLEPWSRTDAENMTKLLRQLINRP